MRGPRPHQDVWFDRNACPGVRLCGDSAETHTAAQIVTQRMVCVVHSSPTSSWWNAILLDRMKRDVGTSHQLLEVCTNQKATEFAAVVARRTMQAPLSEQRRLPLSVVMSWRCLGKIKPDFPV